MSGRLFYKSLMTNSSNKLKSFLCVTLLLLVAVIVFFFVLGPASQRSDPNSSTANEVMPKGMTISENEAELVDMNTIDEMTNLVKKTTSRDIEEEFPGLQVYPEVVFAKKSQRPIKKFEPMVDPNSKLTRKVVTGLIKNYENINDIKYTLELKAVRPAHNSGTETMTVYVKFDPGKCDIDVPNQRLLGGVKRFPGKMKVNIEASDNQTASMILSEGISRIVLSREDPDILEIDSMKQEEMLGRMAGFDSIFGFYYVTELTEGKNIKNKDDYHVLEAHRNKLLVYKNTCQLREVVAFDPYGELELVQQFDDFYTFKEFNFSFPKKITTVTYIDGDISKIKDVIVCHIQNVEINTGLSDNMFGL